MTLTPSQKQCLLLSLKLAFFGATLASVVEDPALSCGQRDLDVVEIFSEAKSIVHAAREKGFCAEAYDLTHGQDSVCARSGFWSVVRLVMRLKPGGLAHMAPECKTFGFACRNQNQRTTKNPEGNVAWEAVCDGNLACMFWLHSPHCQSLQGSVACTICQLHQLRQFHGQAFSLSVLPGTAS